MPAKNENLHGNAPDKSPAALVLIDVINDCEFEGGAELFAQAEPIIPRLAALKRAARAAGIPVVYVNDNFGKWQSDFQKLVDHCLHDDVRGRPMAEALAPAADDYFVLKPKHSGFFSTTLDVLLEHLGVETLILAGIAGNICVLFTAHDAHMRDFQLYVPEDCVASASAALNRQALDHMRAVLKADTAPSAKLDLRRLARRAVREAGAA
ncbi:MAG TPA: isochorismatase family cysteine hydrolase [Herpetosiphonaceae bacterium]